jgi:fatty-acyl-CoA synthase
MKDRLTHPLAHRALHEPERVFAKLYFARRDPCILNYRDFYARCRQYQAAFQKLGISPEDRILILLDHGPDLLAAFVGAMLGGAIPSILATPSVRTAADHYRASLARTLEVCQARLIVTEPEYLPQVNSAPTKSRHFLCPAEVDENLPSAPAPRGEHPVAFIQHSSGTTGLRKGVALSHAAVIRQLEHYAQAISLRSDDKIISWLPLYHDMGLIAGFLQCLWSGVPLILMSPFDWIANPVSLLQRMADDRATLCWQPNFAYTLLADRIAPSATATLDLSHVRAFLNCSETVRATTHHKFLNRYRDNGISPRQLQTCYALAENTFAVTQSTFDGPPITDAVDEARFSTRGRAEPARAGCLRVKHFVSSGRAIAQNAVRILDAEGRDVSDRVVGEIAIRSDSLLSEYFNRPDLSSTSFRDGWFCTGDLGYTVEGELFVTGRKKDLIIVAGKNLYPEDLEEAVSSVEGVFPGRVAAFGIYREAVGTEELVVLAETPYATDTELTGLRQRLAQALKQQLDLSVRHLRLLPRGWLVKSTSGKISRSSNQAKFLALLQSEEVVREFPHANVHRP